MAPGVLKTFKKEFKKFLHYGFEDLLGDPNNASDTVEEVVDPLQTVNIDSNEFAESFKDVTSNADDNSVKLVVSRAYDRAYEATRKATYQAMEGLVHNLNTMHSRSGAQVPFTSLNYGTDTSPEGRMVIENLLLATEAGLGNGETPIFP